MKRFTRIGIIAGLVLALAVAGTATAAKLITGRDIKDGSIGLADFSKSAKKGLTGKAGAQGPAGPAGAAGSAGPAGATGPAGPQSIATVVRGVTVTVASGRAATGEARCPAGMIALSGSVNHWAMIPGVDQPAADGAGWTGVVYNDGSRTSTFDVIVVCAAGTASMPPTTNSVRSLSKTAAALEARAGR